MNENRTNTLLLTVIGVATLLVAVIGASFAYFTAQLTGDEKATTITIGAGVLSIVYNGGPSFVTTEPLVPVPDPDTSVLDKTFTVTGNNSTQTVMPYSINLIVVGNTFTDGALKYTLSSENVGSNGQILADKVMTDITTGAQNISLGTGFFSGSVSNSVHRYVLKIFFPDTGVVQDEDKNKEFNAYVETTVDEIYTT